LARQVVWAPQSKRDLFQQLDYIHSDNPSNAELVNNRILSRVINLSEAPTGRTGRVFGTYEAFVAKTSLVICYELPDDSTLHILRIIHAKRQWLEGEWPKDSE
jgi:plasmid stabilization system protein ParE